MKSVFKGTLTYIPGITRIIIKKKSSTHSCANPRFCYSLWLRQLVFLRLNKITINIEKIAELGNGGSFGVGFCSLLTGSNTYYSLELNQPFNYEHNLRQLDHIFELFDKKTSIPDHNEFPQINLRLGDYSFPSYLFDEIKRKYLLSSAHYEKIKTALQLLNDNQFSTDCIVRILNWEKKQKELFERFDYIFSRAVLEHTDNPASIYNLLTKNLKKNGYMFHDVEFHSHGITKQSNGHYFINDLIWRLIVGNRRNFLNRLTPQEHIDLINENSLSIINKYFIRSSVEYVNCCNSIVGASFLLKKS